MANIISQTSNVNAKETDVLFVINKPKWMLPHNFCFILKNISLQNDQCVKSKQEECQCASVKYPLNIIHSQYIELMVGGVAYKCQWEGWTSGERTLCIAERLWVTDLTPTVYYHLKYGRR